MTAALRLDRAERHGCGREAVVPLSGRCVLYAAPADGPGTALVVIRQGTGADDVELVRFEPIEVTPCP